VSLPDQLCSGVGFRANHSIRKQQNNELEVRYTYLLDSNAITGTQKDTGILYLTVSVLGVVVAVKG
jgi:hypothetical protein